MRDIERENLEFMTAWLMHRGTNYADRTSDWYKAHPVSILRAKLRPFFDRLPQRTTMEERGMSLPLMDGRTMYRLNERGLEAIRQGHLSMSEEE